MAHKRLLSLNNKHCFIYLFRNFYPSVNNNGLIKSIILNGIYPTEGKIRFMSSQYSNKIPNEPEKKI